MELNAAGLTLIKEFEGFRGGAYRDPVGIWTIGYGHTSDAGAPQVFAGQIISEAQASDILKRDVETFSAAVRRAVKVPLNANQFSALVSFTYNVGPGNFLKSSVLRVVNTGEFDHVPVRLNLWVKAGGRNLRGLVRRRKAEGELFATPISEPTQQITFWKRIFTWLWQRN